MYGISAGPSPMECNFHGAETMKTRKQTKYIHEGKYVAEVDVELIETDDE